MKQTSLGLMRLGAHGDRLTESFEEACERGDLETASVLLTEIDFALLAEPMGSDQRATGLKQVRQLRDRLQTLRAASRRPAWRVFSRGLVLAGGD